MENKINVSELLKGCPSGMELDCTMYENTYFDKIDDDEDCFYPIRCYIIGDGIRNPFYLTKYGDFNTSSNAKCVIFPKGKTTWEGFIPPCKFKDGDIVYIKTDSHNHIEFIIIFKEIRNNHIHKHACFAYQNLSIDKCAVCHISDVEIMRLATEEEKQKLFDAIKENGYKWNDETKTLEKLVVPKFKVGYKIKSIKTGNIYEIIKIVPNYYIAKYLGSDIMISFNKQDEYELVPGKFDITTLKPFESRVLVRDKNTEKWKSGFWGFYDVDNAMNYPYECCGSSFAQCIPYEGNEHLLGTTNDCNDYYKNWE